MLYGLKVIATYLLGTDCAGRNLAVYTDDTFVVSYPRSGNTWTRFLIANLAYPNSSVSFANIEKLIPETLQSNRTLKRTPRPRFIKSHEYLDLRYPKTIYIARDPRDVVLSTYYFRKKYRDIDDDFPIERFVDDFIAGRPASGWGTWAEHVASWFFALRHSEKLLFLRYEDMMRDAESELARIAVFLGIEPDPGRLQVATERSSADRLRGLEKLEEKQWAASVGSFDRAHTKGRRKDIPFVGAAKSGEWRTALPENCVHQIESAWGELMTTVGYELVTLREPQRVG
jgi:Sulfotransferase domain